MGSSADRRTDAPAARTRLPAPKMPFWVHQAVEYVAGVGVIVQGVQGGDTVWLAVAGGALLFALAATADGPLGAFRVISRPVHRMLDIVVAVVLVALAVLGWSSLGSIGAILLGGSALLLGFLVVRTDYRPKRSRADKVAARASARAASDALPSKGDDLGRSAGRSAGQALVKGVRIGKAAKGAAAAGIRSFREDGDGSSGKPR